MALEKQEKLKDPEKLNIRELKAANIAFEANIDRRKLDRKEYQLAKERELGLAAAGGSGLRTEEPDGRTTMEDVFGEQR